MRDRAVRALSLGVCVGHLLLGALVLLFAACASYPEKNLHLAPCTIGGAAARCGTFAVRESSASSRILPLKVIVLPATEHNDSAIFPFNGGPGLPTTPGAELETTVFAAERRLHDVVFVDERGTGESAPLRCPEALKAHAREFVEDDLFPAGLIADCRRELDSRIDVAAYSYPHFVDDIDALRRALGYPSINIVGLSYGTRAALTYLATYPRAVRSMLLVGPLAPENLMPLYAASDTEELLKRVRTECRADSRCGEAFDVEGDLGKVAAALDAHPAVVDSGGYHLTISRGAFAEFLRTTMYDFAGERRIPLLLHLAAQGDWAWIAPLFIRQRTRWYDENFPLFMTVSCSSDVRWIEAADAERKTANTLMGDYRVRRQMDACRAWGDDRAPRLQLPARAGSPVLIMTGDHDPVTPPHWAERLAKDVSPSRVVVFANQGHFEPSDCAIDLEVRFFDSGSLGVDASCAEKIPTMEFQITPQ